MAIRAAINGYGRIGRNVLRALYESGRTEQIQLVAINDLGDAAINAHLTRFDSVHGPFGVPVRVEGRQMIVAGDAIEILSEPDARKLPWSELDIDLVLECTGRFTARDAASVHLDRGARKVLVSAPAKGADATIVYGVNHRSLKAEDRIISNASCTTNCLAPMASILHQQVGIVEGLMTTIHSYTNDQNLSDVYHPDPYRARSATQSMIPTKTGAAEAVGLVLPELAGRLTGMAVRVPTINVSLVDLSFTPARAVTADEINCLMREAAAGPMKGILQCNDLPLVSVDFNHNPASCIFDCTQTRSLDNMVKVFAWYDNEWGFSNRMLDTAVCAMGA
ncbi:glyceraldehyde-3-phosphate dehydrogenase [Marinobacterium nitratireducens]|uniref:Glyceraldehyde-3-phosphate dehydrogenase n=1 Tax=Marinobacterium nitratireducens TaxID=518897 RepID=A0A918DNF9_9GAMM|nr:type I glyceraldehyde-3-phosphate dehydrogenase [Marinobacterium nitratireducens]GGO76646.1 glyceraldehyde-3-phosphate dehydrogenase [Marinobacterium nitratireducens]